MASTNKTENLGLSQWEGTDAFMREDLNADLRKLDSAFASGLKLEFIRDVVVEESGISSINVEMGGLDYSKYFMIIIAFREFKNGMVYISPGYSSNNVLGESGAYGMIFWFPLRDPDRLPSTIFINSVSIGARLSAKKYRDIPGFAILNSNSKLFDIGDKLEIWGVKG